MVLLDTTKNTNSKQGRISQVALRQVVPQSVPPKLHTVSGVDSGQILHTGTRKSEHPLENATEHPLENATKVHWKSDNPLGTAT